MAKAKVAIWLQKMTNQTDWRRWNRRIPQIQMYIYIHLYAVCRLTISGTESENFVLPFVMFYILFSLFETILLAIDCLSCHNTIICEMRGGGGRTRRVQGALVFTFRKLLLFVAACDPEIENKRKTLAGSREKIIWYEYIYTYIYHI